MRRLNLALLSLAPLALGAQDSRVKVWQDVVAIPVYRQDPAGPLPPFDQLGLNGSGNFAIYPYAQRENVKLEKYDAPWRALHLENRYLHCRILPEWGGHLYGCTDKISGAEMFYSPVSMKTMPSAPRGTWVAGGIETSFPIAHARLSVSPVQFATASDEDGSASVFVGAVDRISGMEWRIAYTLRPGRKLLEQKVWLYNRSAARQPFQYWANAAIRTPDTGLRLTYPMHVTAPHGAGVLNSWPVNSAGVDLSDTTHYVDTLGVFAYGSREPFFGAYDPASREGVSHWADPKDVPGKKAWVWGTASSDYKDKFSDDHSGYTEIQAGLRPSQEDMEFLQPQHSRVFTELWIPSENTGGITRATPDAVLYLERRRRQDGAAVAAFDLSPTRELAGAVVTIVQGGQKIYEKTVGLQPEKAFHDESGALAGDGKCRFELRDSSGVLLLAHVEDTYDAVTPSAVKLLSPIPKPPLPPGAEAAVLASGEADELTRFLDRAAATYQAALADPPRRPAVRKAAARLLIGFQRFDDAATLLEPLHRELPADAEITYYLGVAKSRQGDDAAARVLWDSMAGDPQFGASAQFESACAMARSGSPKPAASRLLALADRGLGRAAGIAAALLRRAGDAAAAKTAVASGLRVNPMDSLLLVEAGDPAVWRRLAAEPEWVLDVADDYFHVSLFEDAAELLGRTYPEITSPVETDPGTVRPHDYPLVAYYRGYARMRAGQSAVEDFRKASEQSTLHVFPSRASSFAVLREAARQNPQDATAHYLLGCLLLNSRLTDEALAEWDLARGSGIRIPGYYETVVGVLTTLKHDPKQAEAFLREAIAANPEATGLVTMLSRVVAKPAAGGGAPAPAAPAAFQSPVEAAEYALAALGQGQVGAAMGVFTARNFPEGKQPPEVKQAYVEAQLRRLMAAAKAGKCADFDLAIEGVGAEDKGLPFSFSGLGVFVKAPHVQFYIGVAEAACRNPKAAAKRWACVAKSPAAIQSPEFVFSAAAAALAAPGEAARVVEVTLEKVRTAAGSAEPSLLLFAEGMLLRIAGRTDEAGKRFEQGAKTGSAFARYLNGAAVFDPPLAK